MRINLETEKRKITEVIRDSIRYIGAVKSIGLNYSEMRRYFENSHVCQEISNNNLLILHTIIQITFDI